MAIRARLLMNVGQQIFLIIDGDPIYFHGQNRVELLVILDDADGAKTRDFVTDMWPHHW
jgi:hypothetical protein